MKNPVRLAFLLLAGLILAGCTSQTAFNSLPVPKVAAISDAPLGARDHFMMRDIEEKYDRAFGRDR